MALLIPRQGVVRNELVGLAASNAAFGVAITAGSSPNEGSKTELIASTAYDTFGIIIGLGEVATAASTNSRGLVTIYIGGSGSEIALIPDLLLGQAGESNGQGAQPQYYYFPIYIPAGSRLSAASKSIISSDTVNVTLCLLQHQIPGKWYGSRVTAYGISSLNGTSLTTGASGSYPTTVQLTASTTNRIRALQVGMDIATQTTGNNARGLIRVAAGGATNYVVSGLPYWEGSLRESMNFSEANFVLSKMLFDIPAGSYLGVGVQESTSATRSCALYGVD